MLSEQDLQRFQQLLVDFGARIRSDYQHLTHEALDSSNDSRSPTHLAELGTDAYEQEFTISRIENDEELREVVEGALERIAAGTYGSCVECGAKIPKARLNAIPHTPYCIKCAELNEA